MGVSALLNPYQDLCLLALVHVKGNLPEVKRFDRAEGELRKERRAIKKFFFKKPARLRRSKLKFRVIRAALDLRESLKNGPPGTISDKYIAHLIILRQSALPIKRLRAEKRPLIFKTRIQIYTNCFKLKTAHLPVLASMRELTDRRIRRTIIKIS